MAERRDRLTEPERRARSPLGHAIWRARREAGLTQVELADILGCGVLAVARWETGVRTPSAQRRAMLRRRLPHPALRAALAAA